MDSDCEGSQVCDDNGMCVDDTPTCDTDEDCEPGEVCDDSGMCVAEAECETDEDCGEGEVCNDNMCETETPGCTDDTECGAGEFCTEAGSCESGQCANVQPGEDCDPNGDPAGNGLFCVSVDEGSAVCAEAETCPAPDSDEPDPCSSGSECLSVGENGAGACIVTQCELGADECGDGANCQPISRDTNLCLPTGNGAEGDDCSSNFTDLSSSRCGDGLFCDLFYTGVCRTPCNDDNACSGLNSCVGDGNAEIYSSPEGFCAEGCTPFDDRTTCGDGAGCFPLTADEGLCQEAGDIGLYESCTVTACSGDDDCPTDVECNTDAGVCDYGAQCASDGRCVTLEGAAGDGQDGIARCLPSCDPTSDTANDTCPTANPQSFIRFQHLSTIANEGGISAVDVYVDDTSFETDLEYPTAPIATLSFSAVAPGDHNIKIFEAGADTGTATPIIDTDVTLDVNSQTTYTIVDVPGGGNSQTLESFSTPRGVTVASDKIKIRLFHAIPGLPNNSGVDVYIVPADDTPTAGSPIISDLRFGEVSDFPDGSGGTVPFAELDGGGASYDAYIATAGGTDLSQPYPTGDLLGLVTDLAAPDGSILTVAATLNASGEPKSTPLPYAQEEETRVLGGFCLDLAQTADESSPRSGVCFEACGSADNLGKDLCSEPTDNCAPFRSQSSCLPSEDLEVGDTCPTDAFNPCEAGSYCRAYGDGTGVCAKLCTTDDSITNSTLGCPTEQACEEIDADYDVGLCGFECTATDFSDSECPSNLQNCLSPDNGAFCSASSDTAVGEDCGDINPNSCVGGSLCRAAPQDTTLNSLLIDPIQPPEGVSGQCRNACSIFAETSDCPSGEACTIDATDLSTEWGFCLPTAGDYERGGSCDAADEGTICADNSYCLDVGRGLQCETFCDFQNDEGCPEGQSCTAPFGTDGNSTLFGLDRVGLCQ
ncbi:MAG: DUF4397 domain-containing protein [Myxococcota bacterium]